MGRNIKREIVSFSFYDHAGMESHLEEMAAKGWLLKEITGLFWVYRRIEPEKKHFAITYFPKASVYDPEPLEGQLEYQEYCEKNSWHFICNEGVIQVFCSEEENPVPMETDPAVEVDVIHKAAVRRLLPGYLVLTAIALLQLFSHLSSLFDDPIDVLSDSLMLSGFCNIALMLLACMAETACYFHWHRKARKAAQNGEFYETRSGMLHKHLLFFIILLFAGYTIISIVNVNDMALSAVLLGIYAGGVLLNCSIYVIINLFKKKHFPGSLNRISTVIVMGALQLILIGLAVFTAINLPEADVSQNHCETYEYNGHTYALHHDDLPLSVEDLHSIDFEGYDRQKKVQSTIFLEKTEAHERKRLDAPDVYVAPGLDYTIARFNIPLFYGLCKGNLLKNRDKDLGGSLFADHYEPVDASLWSAEAAYQYHWSSEVLNKYILCYNDRLILISFDREPTEDQKKTVAEKLAPGH